MESVLEEAISFATPLIAALDSGFFDVPMSAFLLGGLFIGVFALALFAGKKKMLAVLFSTIFAGFLFSVLPYREMIAASLGDGSQQNELYADIGVFAALFFLLFFAVRHSVRAGYFEDGSRKLSNAIGLSVATSGLIAVYAYQFTPLGDIYPLPIPYLAPLIVSPSAPFWWLAGAFLVVYLFSD
ncbi:MAG: hypothetical protein HYS73_01455 [Parcubacteria group bacterium]|nr:hypothetical protein [Parcubacteria group bacterium]MBI2049131.1 hypothetical protein [Parcubacteria group bacterium]